MKRIVGFVLALVMILSLATPAFAAETEGYVAPVPVPDVVEAPPAVEAVAEVEAAPAEVVEAVPVSDAIVPAYEEDAPEVPPHNEQGCPIDGCARYATVVQPIDPEDIEVWVDEDAAEGLYFYFDQLDEQDALYFIENFLVPFVEYNWQGGWPNYSDFDIHAISQIGWLIVEHEDGSFYEGSGWVQVWNDDWCETDIITIIQFFTELGIFNENMIETFFDPEDGSWWFYVEDIGLASLFFALIERGICPTVIPSLRSPQTADSGVHSGLILFFLFTALTFGAVALKKAHQD